MCFVRVLLASEDSWAVGSSPPTCRRTSRSTSATASRTTPGTRQSSASTSPSVCRQAARKCTPESRTWSMLGSERGWTRGAIECPVGKECYGFVGKGGECQAIVHPSRAQQLPLSFCTPRGLFSGNAHGQAHGGAPACDHHQRRHGHQVVHLPQDRRLHPAWPHIPRKKRCWERVGAFQLIFQHHSFFCSLLFHLLKWFRYFVPTCAPPMSLPSRCLACVLVSLHSTSGDAGDRR